MPDRLRASVVVIGDEILGGFVQDTNSGWLAQRLFAIGVPLDRIVTVPDDHRDIADALSAELDRNRPRVVLTCGGIGSTPDDLTMEAVARCLSLGLTVEPTIAARLDRAIVETAAQGAPLTADHERSMRKMAQVPQTAYLLPGAPAVVPGVAVDVDGGSQQPGGVTVVILPGVPGELRRIVSGSVEPALFAGRGQRQHVAEVVHGYPESALNPVLNRIVAEFPDVHVGSYPGRECVVRLKGSAEEVAAAQALVEQYVEALAESVGADRLRERWRSRWS